MDKTEIEQIEKRYFEDIAFFLNNSMSTIINGLKSKNDIKENWVDIFKSTCRESYNNASELDKGGERVIHNLFGQYRAFAVNSCPIGSDLMFETSDSYLHLEVKTATETNTADFKGKIQIAQNQTTYHVNKTKNGTKYPFIPSLPHFYKNNKICLTYVLQIIHNNNEDEPKIIAFFSIPSGLLHDTYGNCVNAGKHSKKLNRLNSKGDIRFLYKEANLFENLELKPSRIKVLFPTNPTLELVEHYLGKIKL